MALDNLHSHFALAAPIERFDDFLLGCCKYYGWTIPYYSDFNRSKSYVADIDPAFKSKLEEKVGTDMALYEMATKKFEQDLSALRVRMVDRAQLNTLNNGYRTAQKLRSYFFGKMQK